MAAKKITTVLISVLYCCTLLNAQSIAVSDSLIGKAFASELFLKMLIDSAIKNSPEIQKAENNVTLSKTNLKLSKKSLYNYTYFASNYNYGTNYSAINDQGVGSVDQFTVSQTGFYTIGLGVRIPLGQIINRKTMIQAGSLQIDMADADKRTVILALKQEVINRFQALRLAHKLMIASGRNKQTAYFNYQIMEKNFVQGQSQSEEYSMVSDRYSKAVQDYELQVNTFQTNYLLLEALTGVQISQIISKLQ